jgi:malate dehydrogenase (oxaloacetate-decarboxylating)
MGYKEEALKLHKENRGKISVESKVAIKTMDDLALAYTPGVAAVCEEVKNHPESAREYIATKNTVAVVTDGSAVLGLGNIGPLAALPVMEGKAALFKEFAGVDAFPIALNTQDVDEIVEAVERIAPTFGGINLEDISAPRCFEIEARLKKSLNIPVFHDDQHGTAIVVLAALLNALKVTGRKIEDTKVAITGSGAAGIAVAYILNKAGFPRVSIADSKGLVSKCRTDLNVAQDKILACCAVSEICGELPAAIAGADVFVGVSAGGILTKEIIKTMKKNPIIFALANPTPEIETELAKEAGAAVIATGRSDYPNQINNVLAFPGIFKGALEAGVNDITDDMKLAAAYALADLVENPTAENILPNVFERKVVEAIAGAVKGTAKN